MRLIGHTMGTPEHSVEDALRIFARIGLDGAELMCRPDAAFDTAIDDEAARRLADFARALGVPIVAVTPYPWDINSADPVTAAREIGILQRAIELGGIMGAHFVRAFGGREQPDDPDGAFARAVTALRTAAACARNHGVTIVVENHPGTLTRTGRATRRLIDAVGMPEVRALCDPANVLYDTGEDWETTLAAQQDVIAYVHVKDYYMKGGRRHACNVGAGIVPWREILRALQRLGYEGCLSFEYEKKWYPEDLADAEDGMRQSVEFVRKVLDA